MPSKINKDKTKEKTLDENQYGQQIKNIIYHFDHDRGIEKEN